MVLPSLPARSRLHQGSTLPILLRSSNDPRFTSAAPTLARRRGSRLAPKDTPTFRELLNRLSDSDLIVYVQVVDRIANAFGHTYFVKSTATVRYVPIEVVQGGNTTEMVALVAHELQHAVEIAGAPRIRDGQTLAQFYLGMGENSLASGQYDSAEARDTEDRVKRELTYSGISARRRRNTSSARLKDCADQAETAGR